MQEALKLTDEQKKKVAELQKQVDDGLQKTLTEEQNKQLKTLKENAGRSPAGGPGGGADVPANLGELSEKDVMNVLALVRKEYSIDDKRIYLIGHSMGGGGTWHLGHEVRGRLGRPGPHRRRRRSASRPASTSSRTSP